MNPMDMMHMMGALNSFKDNHPKFAMFLKNMLGSGVNEDTIIEITVTRPGEAPVTGNMKVKKSDLELLESLKNMRK